MTSEYCIAMTTLDDEDSASRLARALVEAKLAACVQLMPFGARLVGKARSTMLKRCSSL